MIIGLGTLGFTGTTEIIEPEITPLSINSDVSSGNIGLFLYLEFQPYEADPEEVTN